MVKSLPGAYSRAFPRLLWTDKNKPVFKSDGIISENQRVSDSPFSQRVVNKSPFLRISDVRPNTFGALLFFSFRN